MKGVLFALSLLFTGLVTGLFSGGGQHWAVLPYVLFPLAWYFVQKSFQHQIKASLAVFWAVILFELSPLLLLKPLFSLQLGIGIPLGLSFFVFQAVSFTADWRKKKVISFPGLVDYWLFLIFFPKFLCGPLERFERFNSEIKKSALLPREYRFAAFELLIFGLVKKFLIANYLHSLTAPYFDQPGPASSLLEAKIITYVFAVEFYCDFSAYTDFALGVALLFGVQLSQNFNQPYLARNVQDFWQRWHMSLSAWFRDYVHFPLFFSTKSLSLTVFLTFFLMGLWHGFGANYIALGAYWGFVMVLYSLLQPQRVQWNSTLGKTRWYPVFTWLLTMHVVLTSFFLLRAAGTHAWQRLSVGEPLRITPFVEQSLLRLLFVLPLLICVEMVRYKQRGLAGLSLNKKIGLFVLLAYYSFILFYFTEEKGLTDVRFLYFQF